MSRYININGQIVKSGEPVIRVENRSFKYGDGLFETMRVIDEHPVFFKYHLERLYSGMDMLQMQPANVFQEQSLHREIVKLLRAAQLKNAKIRLHVYRGGEGKYTPERNDAGFVIQVEPAEKEFVFNTKGSKVDIFENHLKPLTKLARLKSANSLLYVMAGKYKTDHNLDEAIILNSRGELCEGVSSNLFLLMNKKLYTPDLESGCIPGVMRKQVIDLAQKGGIEVVQGPLNPEILTRADELFFTNAGSGITWALSFKSRRFYNKFSSQLQGYINGMAFDEVQEYESGLI